MATKAKSKPIFTKFSYVFKAKHKYAQISPFKARYIMDAIRHKPVNEALTLLKFTNRRSASMIDKVLRSAIANAIDYADTNNVDIPVDALYIVTAVANEGPRAKRWRARSRGIANPILKRTSHLVIEIGLPLKSEEEEDEEVEEKIKTTAKSLDKIGETIEQAEQSDEKQDEETADKKTTDDESDEETEDAENDEEKTEAESEDENQNDDK